MTLNWETVSQELSKPLSPDAIKPPPEGKYGEYVDALHVQREANRIFGFNGWSYVIKTISLTNSGLVNGLHRVGYMAVVKVTVDGVEKEDVGHGQGYSKTSEGDAHDSAVKEAVTDAMKRALRTFGNTFGLALYEKDINAREVGYTADANEVAAAIDAINGAETMNALIGYWKEFAANEKLVSHDVNVIAAKDAMKEKLKGNDK